MPTNTAQGIKLGSDYESLYFIRYSFDLDLKFTGSQEDREEQFENYIIPLVAPFAVTCGLSDYECLEPTEEHIRNFVRLLEGDFTGHDNLKEWCEYMDYKALCYWDLNDDDDCRKAPVWLN